MRGIRYLTKALGVIAGISAALMMLHVMADVVGKYFLNKPVPSTAEVVANYYMIACVFLSLAYIEARGSAISVDLIYEKASLAAQRVMSKVGQIVTLLFYLGFGWFSLDVAMRAYRVNETVDGLWRVTIWPAKFMLPIGLAIACIILVIKIFGGDRALNGSDHQYSHGL
jgi:TRAP-type C4-dicarboxylate transport system permease small subunit